jgi:hypothetical protein
MSEAELVDGSEDPSALTDVGSVENIIPIPVPAVWLCILWFQLMFLGSLSLLSFMILIHWRQRGLQLLMPRILLLTYFEDVRDNPMANGVPEYWANLD